MLELEDDDSLIMSSNGDVRGRKGLVEEIRRIASGNSSLNSEDSIHKKIDRDTLWKFEANKTNNNNHSNGNLTILNQTSIDRSTYFSIPIKNKNNSNLIPILEHGQHGGQYVSSTRSSRQGSVQGDHGSNGDSQWSRYSQGHKSNEADEISTDFGYWDHRNTRKTPGNTYSLNLKESPRVLHLPDRYINNYGRQTTQTKVAQPITQWHAVHANTDDNKPIDTAPSSRNSSIRSYNKALPVGEYATQKFRIVQDEEQFTENPKIYDVTDRQISNLEKTCEFDYIHESVVMDICDFKTANVDIKIEEVKYSRKKITDKMWLMKTTEVSRSVNIDFLKSNHGDMVRDLIYEKMTRLDSMPNHEYSAYVINADEFQLSGHAAYTVFNVLMDIAENDSSIVSGKATTYKRKFTPRYLLAILREEETILNF